MKSQFLEQIAVGFGYVRQATTRTAEARPELLGVRIQNRQERLGVQLWKLNPGQLERCAIEWHIRIPARDQFQ